MRKSNKVTVNGQEIRVFELSVRQIRSIIDDLDNLDNQRALEILEMCSDITMEQIEDMAPSDIRDIWDAWSGVNADFLYLIRQAMKRPPIQRAIDDFLETILNDVYAALSSAGTAPDALNMAGDSLSNA